MKSPRTGMRNLRLVLVALGMSGLPAGMALASASATHDYPNRPIRIIVPYAAGGADQQIRPLMPDLQKALGQPLVIENVGGAGGVIGSNMVKSSAPDGYTLLYTATAVLTIAPKLNPAPYKIDDFVPVCNVIDIPFLVAARKGLPFQDAAGMKAYALEHANAPLAFGSAGLGTATHLAGEAMADAMGAPLLHVPFQGMAPAVTLLLGGGIDMVVGAPGVIMPQIRGDKIVPIATTGARRFEASPDIPALQESGIDIDAGTKYGFFAPAGTDPAIVEKLSRAIGEAAQSAGYRTTMRNAYNGVRYLDSNAYAAELKDEDAYYTALLKRLGLGGKP
ncbi:tripartite tricarboxylate transporter substrate binding protein [Bordetella sp. BOR01]|uniref:tripartite tricarboxylate transporter substrate binding protein n=1 Tax=Bordetella sp. BOR01 TaxID=2854779 RepID=UPI001C45AC1A|nr:tripartite tricarboxylate transporter substrate binding protein [Bordetella sp. BOR01]MBV7486846.1 tripartite tricarboxylate transporter substrate binding protein [Bordetella sp. BOR01]